MSVYDEYKPFRNYLRRLDLVSSLVDIWQYSIHVMDDRPLPTSYAIGMNELMVGALKRHLYPWDLDVLCREIVLHARIRGDRSLKKWNDLAGATNHIRRLDGFTFEHGGRGPPDVMFELHRIAHRQFSWQQKLGVSGMMRAFKVFGAAEVERIVFRDLGLTTTQYLQLGAAISGHFLNKARLSSEQDYAVLGIPRDASRSFFKRITCTLAELRAELVKRQSYDKDWLYTWNPLEATPLISFDPAHPERLICPIPHYLLRRVSSGLFYDLVKSRGFDNPYGYSFEGYVGEVIAASYRGAVVKIEPERPYKIGNRTFRGVDWSISDKTGHLLVESKTKRLTVNSKTRSDWVALDADLQVMATAVVQRYQNIQHMLDGRTHWVPDDLPIFPVILTLEDWFIFSPRVSETLDAHVRRLLAAAGLPETLLTAMPYTIASAHEFEIAIQVIQKVGITPVMNMKSQTNQRGWSLLPSISQNFPNEMRATNWFLFKDDWLRLMPPEISLGG